MVTASLYLFAPHHEYPPQRTQMTDIDGLGIVQWHRFRTLPSGRSWRHGAVGSRGGPNRQAPVASQRKELPREESLR